MDQKKRQILETAKGLFLRRGFKSTTIQSIADEVGVSKGAVYLQFPSKKDIFFEILLESEEEVWEQVLKVRSDASTSAREKLVGIFELYFEYIRENRLLTELQIQEVGMALTEDMLVQALAIRDRWQNVFDDLIATVLGNEYDDWKGDLGFTVVAVLEMYHACLLINNIEIEKKALIQFLLLFVESMGPALDKARKDGAIEPLFKRDYLATREKTLEDLEQKRRDDIHTVLAKIQQTLTRIQSSETVDQHSIYQESVKIFQNECLAAVPVKAVVQGMLAGLRGVSELSLLRQQLADLMGVRLV